MAKDLLFDEPLRVAMRNGVNKIADAVSVTLGPKGKTVGIDRSWGAPKITKDGASVAEEVKLVDRSENAAAQVIKVAAQKTSKDAGDGTTTSVVLARELFLNGMQLVEAGANPLALFRGMQKGVEAVVAQLGKQAITIKDKEKIRQVATLACNGDEEIGAFIADTLDKVGKDGVCTVEEGKTIKNELELVQGMAFDRGYVSSQFVTDQDKGAAVLENALVFLYEDKLNNAHKLVPLLEKVMQLGRPLLIVAEDVEGDALATLVVNQANKILKVCCVKAPGYGDRRKEIMEDIAVLTHGRFFTKDLGVELKDIHPRELGQARKIIVDKENTTIVEGAGTKAEIQERVNLIRHRVEKADNDYDREKLKERLARFSGGIAKLMIGAASETEMREKKQRAQDALNATRSAIAHGVVAGGGVALARAAVALDKLKLDGEDEELGRQILRKSLSKPLCVIAGNAGLIPGVVLNRVMNDSTATAGFDARTGAYGDAVKLGILDPLNVVKSAVTNATSCAGILLTTSASITAMPEKKGKGGHHGHDHDHDDMM